MAKKIFLGNRIIIGGILTFILSRVFFYWFGVRFNATPLTDGWHYIDPVLMQSDLLRSLWYLHSQPPLFNLGLGLFVKCFPEHLIILVLHLCYMLLGCVFTILLASILIRSGISNLLSFLITVFFITGPICLLYENVLMYDYPCMFLLICSAFLLQRLLQSRRFLDYSLFFGTLACLVLIRSFFHFAWFLVWVGLLCFVQASRRKHILIAACLPCLLIGAVYCKTFLLFDAFSTSTWLGMSLAKLTLPQSSLQERQAMVQHKEVSPLVLIRPFSEIQAYTSYVNISVPTNIPVLAQELKSTGYTNYNHIGYIRISKQYLDDTLHIIAKHPQIYLRSLYKAVSRYFDSSANLPVHYNNIIAILTSYQFYNATFYRPLVNLLLFLSAMFYGGWETWKLLCGKSTDRFSAVLTVFLVLNILYVTVVGNFLEFGENNRFRFMIEPFLYILFAQCLHRILLLRMPSTCTKMK